MLEWHNPDFEEIKRILGEIKTIAVVGLAAKPERASNEVAQYLIDNGFDIIPVNPVEQEILGRKSYPDLKSIDRPVDLVDIFRKAEAVPPIVDEAIDIGAKYIWLQLGIISEEAYKKATEAGIPIIMDRCILQEHKKI